MGFRGAGWTTTQIVEYAYDYNNVWIRKVIGNNKTIFIPENYQTAVQIDNNTVSHNYLWTPNQQDKLLADTTTDNVSWSLTDHLGTIRDILGDNTTHLIYDAFGNLTSGTNPLLFGFTGKAFDTDTDLQNNINRWYDATVGRWLSTDPIGFEGNDTNLYRYVENRPFAYLDTFGQMKYAPARCTNTGKVKGWYGTTVCRFYCTCPEGYMLGLSESQWRDSPCDRTPQPTCFKPEPTDYLILALALGLTCADGPLPVGDSAAVVIGGSRVKILLGI